MKNGIYTYMARLFLPVSLAAIFCITGGCVPDTGGVDPPNDQLIFPVALATTRDATHLLVVNSNYDLRYNSGTLLMLSLAALDGAGDTTADDKRIIFDEASGVFTVPDALSKFCTGDRKTDACTLDASRAALPEETIRLGAYASDLQMTADQRWALIPVRGDRAIMVVEVDEHGDDKLYCGDQKSACDAAHRVRSNSRVNLPIEPLSVAALDYPIPASPDAASDAPKTIETFGFATHLAGGEVSLFSIATTEPGQEPVINAELISVIGGVIDGASGIATNPLNRDIYVVGRRDPNPHVAVLRVLADLSSGGSYRNNPWFSQAATIPVASQIYGGTEARSIAVSPKGDEAFFVTHQPPALIKVNLETYETIDMTTVCPQPTRVKTWIDRGASDDPDDDVLYAFVLCFLTQQMHIVRTDVMMNTVRLTGQGPQDIAFDPVRKLAYVANFRDSTITPYQAYPPFNQIRIKSAKDPEDVRWLQFGSSQSAKEK